MHLNAISYEGTSEKDGEWQGGSESESLQEAARKEEASTWAFLSFLPWQESLTQASCHTGSGVPHH